MGPPGFIPVPAGGMTSVAAGLVGLAGSAGLAGACAKAALQANAQVATKIDFFIIRYFQNRADCSTFHLL
jgi:hypothetical protein